MIVVQEATGCSRRLLSCVAVSVRLQRLPGRLSLPSSGCRSCGICDGGGVISPQRGFQPAEMSTGDCDCRRLCTLSAPTTSYAQGASEIRWSDHSMDIDSLRS
ncbi:hypothetical protein ALC56_12329 [Trachymyrmex septentrionalis]|uniref:Uncharacterized protein n=1 Tax=Trachymyrmex septentrionalis TaxID=34720 RepID=A0A195F0D2_9HYME|nr:hypothetical protein ALC56_12329 [Trachymyrmex septentrionalis]